MAAEWVLGVDFGTVNTAAALCNPSGQVSELRLSTTGPLMPSAVFCGDEHVLAGHRALAAGRSDRAALEMYPKRRLETLDSKWDVAFHQPKAYVPELIAAALSEVRQQTRAMTDDGIPEQLVLTYPDIHRTSSWQSAKIRDGLQAAVDLLACRYCRLLPESMALTTFIGNEPQYTAPVVVVNLGATHCDAMVCLRRTDGSYAAVAPRHFDGLGALTVEAHVREWVNRSLRRRSPALLAALDEQATYRMQLDLGVRDAVGALSTAKSANITLDFDSDQIRLRLTRQRFDVLSRGYVDEVVDLTRGMVAVAASLMPTSTPSVIILTGSAARNPTLRARIAELGYVADFGDPATIIARGAAYHGAQQAGAGPTPVFPSPAPRPQPAAHPRPESPIEREPVEQAPVNKAPARRLFADVTRDDRRCTKSLAPHCEHRLHVRIAVPGSGDDQPTSDAAATADGERDVELQVDVSSDDGSVHGPAPLVLPVSDRTLSSTEAVVKFVTGEEGSTVRLNIAVLHAGRPIQAALLVAPVRAKPAWRDRITLLPIPLGAASEPRTDATQADATVEHTGSALKRLGTTDCVETPWSAVEDIAAAIVEQSASTVLTAGDLAGSAGMKLLVDLARQGSRLADKLADLGLTDAHTIRLVVRGDSPIVPLELAYSGVAPHDNAQLCGCVSDPRARPVPGTSHASPRTVCPYAFWGMNRAITRIVMGRPVKRLKQRPPLAPLSLRPVLYGVADEADDLSPPWAKPTTDLEDGLVARAGRDQCIRVRNRRGWRNAVKRSKPELVVLLGRPEMRDGKANFIIGKNSRLISPLMSLGDFVADMPAPVVLLLGCASTAPGDGFDGLPGSFIDMGATAVVSTLTSVQGAQAAAAAGAIVSAMHSNRLSSPTLATALMEARRQLVARGLVVGLLLVAHGELDIPISAQPTRA